MIWAAPVNKLFSILLLILLAGLAGCGTIKEKVSDFMAGDDNAISREPLVDFEQSIGIKKIWSTRIGGGTDGYYLKLTPVASAGVIYAAEHDGVVQALDSSNGKQIWKHKTRKPVTGGPGLGEGMVLVGTRDGEVLALSETDGEFLWEAQVSSEILAAPRVDLGVVVVRTVDGKVFGLDSASGQRLWVYERAVPLLTLRGTSAPQLQSGLAVIGFDGGILAALEIKSGSLIWEKRIALPSGRSTLERMVDIDAEPRILDGVVHVATFQGRVAVVRLETGDVAWVRDLSSYAGLSVDFDHVYLTDEHSEIWALDRISGDSVWKQEQLKNRALTAPASYGDYLVAGDFEGYLHWLNREDGSMLGRIRLDDSQIIAAPFVADDTLFAYSSDGVLSAFRVQ